MFHHFKLTPYGWTPGRGRSQDHCSFWALRYQGWILSSTASAPHVPVSQQEAACISDTALINPQALPYFSSSLTHILCAVGGSPRSSHVGRLFFWCCTQTITTSYKRLHGGDAKLQENRKNRLCSLYASRRAANEHGYKWRISLQRKCFLTSKVATRAALRGE